MAESKSFVVKLVQQGDEKSQAMQATFEAVQASKGDCVWVTEDDCMEIDIRERTSVFIMANFSGAAFEHLTETKNRVYGPTCLMTCLRSGEKIPNSHPLFSLSLRGTKISCTCIDQARRAKLHQKIEWMCGMVSKVLDEQVTHLVCGEVGSKKYIVAANLKKPIMTPEWLENLWEASKTRDVHGDDDEFKKYLCPVFRNLVITVSGVESSERAEIKQYVESEGGKYSGEMKLNDCTHLIINQAKGQKYEFAKKWKIHIVSPKWLYDSIDAGFCEDVLKYKVEPPDGQTRTVKTSTPTKNNRDRMSSISDVSAISMTHINETGMTTLNASRMSMLGEFDPLDSINLNAIKADMFLDGCKIFLSGFSGQRLTKLVRIINLGGGTRFNQINESVTHIVTGERVDDLAVQLKQTMCRPHVVSVMWLIDCLKQRQLLNEEPYATLDLPPLESASPMPKGKKAAAATAAAAAAPALPPPDEKDEMNEMQDLMSQYMPSNNTDMTDESALLRAVEAGEAEVQQQQQQEPAPHAANHHDDDDDDDATQDPTMEDEGDGQNVIFAGKQFVILGFSSEDEEQLAYFITDAAGKVVPLKSRGIPDYAVVPITGWPVTRTVGDTVTNTWLQMCVESQELLPVDGHELFKPIALVPDKTPLTGSVLSVSGFSGAERDTLMHIAEVLGAICQEFFVRRANKGFKASTHLITSTASGSKYEASKKWKLPAVSKSWLFECAKTGVRQPEEKYHIDLVPEEQSTLTGDDTVELPKPSTPAAAATVTPAAAAAVTPARSETPVGAHAAAAASVSTPVATTTAATPGTAQKHPATPREEDASDSDPEIEIITKKPRRSKESPAASIVAPAVADTPKYEPQKENKKSTPAAAARLSTDDVFKSPAVAPKLIKSTAGTDKTTPVNKRVQALKENKNASPVSPADLGNDDPNIVTPSKFLGPGTDFRPVWDLTAALKLVETPPGEVKPPKRKSSLSLEELYTKNLAIALRNSAIVDKEQNAVRTPRTASLSQLEKAESKPLEGVVIAVSKKLSDMQSEYNTIASSLGAEYQWSYDESCTHYIFKGRKNDMNKEFRLVREHRKKIVSPHWLLMCQEQNCHVDESLFPHTYNPNLSLSMKETPARSTRSTRTRAIKNEPPPVLKLDLNESVGEPSTEPTTSTKPTTSKVEVEAKDTAEVSAPPDVKSDEDKSPGTGQVDVNTSKSGESEVDMDQTQSDEEMAAAAMDLEKDNMEQEASTAGAFVHDLKNLIAAKKPYSKNRRKSKRSDSLNTTLEESTEVKKSSGSSNKSKCGKQDDEEDRSGGRGASSRIRIAHGTLDTQMDAQSQMVVVSWDDPGVREQQELLANELAKNSESFSPKPEPYTDDEQHAGAQSERLQQQAEASEAAARSRIPTPERPALALPLTKKHNDNVGEHIELIDQNRSGDDEDDDKTMRMPVFLLTGMNQQEKDDYGALVEELGGQLSDLQVYDDQCTHLISVTPSRTEKYLAFLACGKWVLHKSYFEACRKEGRFVEESPHEWGSDGMEGILGAFTATVKKLAHAAHRWRGKMDEERLKNSDCKGAFTGWTCVLITDPKREDSFRRLLEAGGATVLPPREPIENLADVTHAFMDLNKAGVQVDVEAFVCAGVNCVKPEYIAAYLSEDPTPQPRDYMITEAKELVRSTSSGRKRRPSTVSTPNSKRTRRT